MKDDMVNEFDKAIQASMKDLEVPYDPGSWDILKERIASEAAAVQDGAGVDELASDALSNLTVPYDPKTWKILSDRLDQIDYKRKLFALKLFEAAVILLAILTAVRFIGHLPSATTVTKQEFASTLSDERSPTNDVSDLPVKTQEDANSQVLLGSDLGSSVDKKAASQKIRGIGSDFTKSSASSAAERVSAQEIAQDVEIFNAVPSNATEGLAGNQSVNIAIDRKGDERAQQMPRAIGNGIEHIGSKSALVVEPKYPLRSAELRSVEPVFAPISSLDLATLDHEKSGMSLTSIMPIQAKPGKIHTSLGLYRQSIHHSYEFEGNARSKGMKKAEDIGVGVVANVQFGRVGFDFGAAYEHLTYVNVNSNTPNEIHKVQIPVNLRVVPIRNKYFKVYVKGGASVHGVLYARYTPPISLSLPLGQDLAYGVKYDDGLALDGLAANNMYMTLNAGVGIEANIGDRFSIFAEKIYENHAKGAIGNHGDKLSSKSFNLGVSYSL